MSTTPQGIFNYSKMNDRDKSYLVKLLGSLVLGVIAGITTGIIYTPGREGITTGWIGLLIFIVGFGLLSWYINEIYDLQEMSTQQIIRHGIFVSFLSYLWLWVVIFQFFIF